MLPRACMHPTRGVSIGEGVAEAAVAVGVGAAGSDDALSVRIGVPWRPAACLRACARHCLGLLQAAVCTEQAGIVTTSLPCMPGPLPLSCSHMQKGITIDIAQDHEGTQGLIMQGSSRLMPTFWLQQAMCRVAAQQACQEQD